MMANFFTSAFWNSAFRTPDFTRSDCFFLDGRTFLDESVQNGSAI